MSEHCIRFRPKGTKDRWQYLGRYGLVSSKEKALRYVNEAKALVVLMAQTDLRATHESDVVRADR